MQCNVLHPKMRSQTRQPCFIFPVIYSSHSSESTIFYVYIYIYGRGRRFPERTSIRIIELKKKQCFTVVKWTFFIFFFSLLMSFNYGSIFFRPSKLKSSSDHHKLFFLVLLFSPLELRGAFFVLYQRSLEEGIIYCVSTGILMWCCFSLVIHSVFA